MSKMKRKIYKITVAVWSMNLTNLDRSNPRIAGSNPAHDLDCHSRISCWYVLYRQRFHSCPFYVEIVVPDVWMIHYFRLNTGSERGRTYSVRGEQLERTNTMTCNRTHTMSWQPCSCLDMVASSLLGISTIHRKAEPHGSALNTCPCVNSKELPHY